VATRLVAELGTNTLKNVILTIDVADTRPTKFLILASTSIFFVLMSFYEYLGLIWFWG
jgi:hypothetical protein